MTEKEFENSIDPVRREGVFSPASAAGQGRPARAETERMSPTKAAGNPGEDEREKETEFFFKRIEQKYMLPPDAYLRFMEVAGPHLIPDEYHISEVHSIYYDTDNYALIRHSIEKPVYKEKLRVRSYGPQEKDGICFVELKKKYEGIVYKRRVQMTPLQAEQWLSGEAPAPENTQITREIDWFLKMNDVSPKVLISCRRVSWKDKDIPGLRFTFDSSLRQRADDLHLYSGDEGEMLLPEGYSLMEIKIPEAAPMWLARLLSDEEIFPASYSKYGTFYKNMIWREKNA